MNEERNAPRSTAELAYGRQDEPPTKPPMDDGMQDRQTDPIGPESGRTTTQDAMPAADGDMQRKSAIEEHPREVPDTSIEQAPLLDEGSTSGYTSRWHEVQAKFVEEPKDAVREADGLVAEVIQALASSFADQRSQLEGKWDSGSDVTTEDLRQALIQYRSFFQRLLAA
jgi:hypothetical protein